MKKISIIVLISVLIVPQGLACTLSGDLCINWIRGNTDSDIFCVMNSDHDEGSRDDASSLWIKSPMESCGNMAGTSLYSEFLTNLKRDPQPSARQYLIPKIPVISESSSQTKLLYQESWVTTSDPSVKIFKEVNSYII
ncbi:MAG: hypothetical protein V3U58_00510 [Thermodesulfobacteriota bacterium]